MTDVSISTYGVYIPSNRMERSAIAEAHRWAMPALKGLGKGQKAFCDWDEDSITMGVEASRGCIKSLSNAISSITFASTTPVYSDMQNASIIASALRCTDVSTMDTTGSLRAGTTSLINAFERVKSGHEALVIASDNRNAQAGSVQEMEYGSGSAAVTVSADGGIANYLGSESCAANFVDHFRAPDRDYDYYWEQRWIRDEGYLKIVPPVVNKLLEKCGIEAGNIAHFCINSNIAGADGAVARKLGIGKDAITNNLNGLCGNTGAAQPLVMLAGALEKAKPGDYILVVGFGAGCDAILLQATEALTGYQSQATLAAALARGKSDSSYLRMLSFNGQIKMDWGMRAEVDPKTKTKLTQAWRSADQIDGFVGGECSGCGQIQFPVLAMCVNCGSSEKLKPVPLADAPAKIMTSTEDWLQFTPSPPFFFGLVQFDNGARVLMEFVDITKDQLDPGRPLRMVFRIKERDELRGYSRYFWKATPATDKQGE
jgi:3-hydroxy-3-methylglutaryl CoA synthase